MSEERRAPGSLKGGSKRTHSRFASLAGDSLPQLPSASMAGGSKLANQLADLDLSSQNEGGSELAQANSTAVGRREQRIPVSRDAALLKRYPLLDEQTKQTLVNSVIKWDEAHREPENSDTAHKQLDRSAAGGDTALQPQFELRSCSDLVASHRWGKAFGYSLQDLQRDMGGYSDWDDEDFLRMEIIYAMNTLTQRIALAKDWPDALSSMQMLGERLWAYNLKEFSITPSSTKCLASEEGVGPLSAKIKDTLQYLSMVSESQEKQEWFSALQAMEAPNDEEYVIESDEEDYESSVLDSGPEDAGEGSDRERK